jgi:hypothetical protein
LRVVSLPKRKEGGCDFNSQCGRRKEKFGEKAEI